VSHKKAATCYSRLGCAPWCILATHASVSLCLSAGMMTCRVNILTSTKTQMRVLPRLSVSTLPCLTTSTDARSPTKKKKIWVEGQHVPLLHAVVLLLRASRVRLIDFTASRLQTPGCDVVFCDLEGEDGLFDGPKGKPQFETYRCARLVHI